MGSMKEISYRVMRTNEFKDAIYYKVECGCGSNEDALVLEFEHDKKIPNMIFLNIYKKLIWSVYWHSDHWWEVLWGKIEMALKILFLGRIEVEGTFIIDGEEHINSFIEALIQGKRKMRRKIDEPQKPS